MSWLGGMVTWARVNDLALGVQAQRDTASGGMNQRDDKAGGFLELVLELVARS